MKIFFFEKEVKDKEIKDAFAALLLAFDATEKSVGLNFNCPNGNSTVGKNLPVGAFPVFVGGLATKTSWPPPPRGNGEYALECLPIVGNFTNLHDERQKIAIREVYMSTLTDTKVPASSKDLILVHTSTHVTTPNFFKSQNCGIKVYSSARARLGGVLRKKMFVRKAWMLSYS